MNKIFISAVLFSFLLGACSEGIPEEGIPEVRDVNNIVVHNVKMSKNEFVRKYCQVEKENKTCAKVIVASSKDSLTKPGVTKW